MSADCPRATEVDIWLPAYRGKSLIPLLSWLVVERLAAPDGEATWHIDKKQGPASLARTLTELGWDAVGHRRAGKDIQVTGRPPAGTPLPVAAGFDAVVGDIKLSFAADYGVFSPRQIDQGTALLLEVALREPAVETLADIGVGYGPLAVGLVRNGVAARAVATDVDCIALWLAGRNAAANGVPLELRCTPDPREIEPTALTVCNVPTHLPAAESAELMRALAARATGGGRLLAVVHASLEARYTQHLAAAGVRVTSHPGAAHVVLAGR
jgi:16S rRNA (guanine1207-N2)-methyltransferase